MNIQAWLIRATLASTLVAGSACAQKNVDQTEEPADVLTDTTKQSADAAHDTTREAVETTADETKSTVDKIGEKTKEIAGKTADKTKEIVGAIGGKSKEVVSATGEKITDGWITTKVSAKFVNESLLKDSNINVDTKDHVVTLKGTVVSDAAKTRAASIARESEGVTRVVNQLVVRVK